MELWLPYVWAGLLALAVFIYVLLDGFDLGLGILFPFANSDHDRDVMMTSVAPVWDGNETWLVFGGGGLFAVFPQAYAALMPSVYMPIGFMLIALIFRGVAFEFRFSSQGILRRFWDQAFHWGSIIAAFSQGLILGAMVQGIDLVDDRFAGDMFDWLTPFSFFTGCALVWGYSLLGSTWLIMKTEGELLAWARKFAFVSVVVVLLCLAIVTITVPFMDVVAAHNWGINFPEINWQKLITLSPIPLATLFCCWQLVKSVLDPQSVHKPFLYSIATFALAYFGLIISFFPYIIPYSLTIEAAAAAPNSQAFLLVGAVFLLPVILTYTGYVYWVFRGKVDMNAGYH